MSTVNTKQTEIVRQLSKAELNLVSGGMRWERGVRSGDVIDARGGSFSLGGFHFARGGDGKWRMY